MNTKQRTDEQTFHEMTEAERMAVEKYVTRSSAKPSVRVKISKNGSDADISVDHPDQRVGHALIMKAFGSVDLNFAKGLLSQLAAVSECGGDIDADRLNFLLSIINGIEPRDMLESMLGAQMSTVHMACMMLASRLVHSKNTLEQDSAERALNKLNRTFAIQMETLTRYRSSAKQKVAAPQLPARNDTNVVLMPTPDENKEHDALSNAA